MSSALVAALLPYYPKGEGRGRSPVGLERMLRMYIAQQCFGLSDEGIEDAIYDSQAIRGFVGIDLTHESAPDATTLLKQEPRRKARSGNAPVEEGQELVLRDEGPYRR
jgi:hypothetical protein